MRARKDNKMQLKYLIKVKSKQKPKLLLFLLVLISLAIFYFSWIPDPCLKSEHYLPVWVLYWSNLYYNLRTAVPFIGFGFLLEALFSVFPSLRKNRSPFYMWFLKSVLVLTLVCVAEGGQFFVLNRHPDIMDVLYGVLGSQLGFLIYIIMQKVINRF